MLIKIKLFAKLGQMVNEPILAMNNNFHRLSNSDPKVFVSPKANSEFYVVVL